MKRRKRKAAQVFISGEEFCNSRRRETRRGMDIPYKAQETDFGSPPVLARFTCLIPLGRTANSPSSGKDFILPANQNVAATSIHEIVTRNSRNFKTTRIGCVWRIFR